MICNIGPRDRILRMLIGIVLLIGKDLVSPWFMLIGVFLVVTGFLRWCPFYLPFKLNSK